MKNSNKIPKAKIQKNSTSHIPKQNSLKTSEKGLKFSFEALETNEYFALDGTCPNWTRELLNMLKECSAHSAVELRNGGFQNKFRVHNHETADPPSNLPEGVALKDLYQIRISQSKGGIHGIFGVGDVFYVIWLDPLHNMYPDKRYGGLRKVKAGSTCCKDRDEELALLREELENTKNEAKEWKELALSIDENNQNKIAEEVKC